jgi:cyanate lyase
MSDLISRKALNEAISYALYSSIRLDTSDIRDIINNQPTAYDVEKVVERLELENKRLKTLRNNCIALSDHEVIGIESRAYRFAIEIVRRGGQG